MDKNVDIETVKAFIQQALADGRLDQVELDQIQALMRADGVYSIDEEALMEMITQRIMQGEIEWDESADPTLNLDELPLDYYQQ